MELRVSLSVSVLDFENGIVGCFLFFGFFGRTLASFNVSDGGDGGCDEILT